MAEANQTTAPAGGETTDLAERLYGKEPAEAPASVESPAEPVSLADKLYPNDKPKEPASEGEQSGEPAEAVQQAEPYNLRLPEGVFVTDEPLLNEFTTWARENRLTEEQVQAAANFHLRSNAAREAAEFRASGEKRLQEVEGWREEFNKDPYFGRQSARQSISEANRALSAYATPQEVKQLTAEFHRTGIEYFPPLLRLLARVGRTVKAPPTGSKPGDMARRLYPDLD